MSYMNFFEYRAKRRVKYPTVVVTSGGTSVYIDQVRKITNSSSGKLGSVIANELVKKFKRKVNVIYIHSRKAVMPKKCKSIYPIKADTVEEVDTALNSILIDKYGKPEQIKAVIHAMAISDYTLDYVTTVDKFADSLKRKRVLTSSKISHFLKKPSEDIKFKEKKISSSEEDLLIRLKPTPKIINTIKKLNPNTLLIGFKLLTNARQTDVEAAIEKLFTTASCDFVLYNDKYHITPIAHYATLYSNQTNSDNSKQLIKEFRTKKDIGKGLAALIANPENFITTEHQNMGFTEELVNRNKE